MNDKTFEKAKINYHLLVISLKRTHQKKLLQLIKKKKKEFYGTYGKKRDVKTY